LPHLIDETGHSATAHRDHKEESTMFKTISAALLAVSVLAAPAMAATATKTATAPAVKTEHVKKNVLNANAKMVRHHHAHYRHHRYSHLHKKTMKSAALKTHKLPKVSAKHVTHAVKRG
jgi:Ni/Co efflux regulator RcnB